MRNNWFETAQSSGPGVLYTIINYEAYRPGIYNAKVQHGTKLILYGTSAIDQCNICTYLPVMLLP